jgi:hypothetical protein
VMRGRRASGGTPSAIPKNEGTKVPTSRRPCVTAERSSPGTTGRRLGGRRKGHGGPRDTQAAASSSSRSRRAARPPRLVVYRLDAGRAAVRQPRAAVNATARAAARASARVLSDGEAPGGPCRRYEERPAASGPPSRPGRGHSSTANPRISCAGCRPSDHARTGPAVKDGRPYGLARGAPTPRRSAGPAHAKPGSLRSTDR